MTIEEKYWLAGILEGEGCFSPQNNKYYASITVEMTDEDIIAKVAKILDINYYKCGNKNVIKGWKQTYKINMRGLSALKIMREIQPLMGIRRFAKIQQCIDSYNPKLKGKLTYEETIKIFELKGKESLQNIVDKFKISKWRVYQIWRGDYLKPEIL